MTRPFEAATAAFDRAGRVLFQPFEPRKYLVLAFCAWLYQLGRAVPTAPGRGRMPTGGAWDPAAFQGALDFVRDNAAPIAAGAAAALVVGVAVWVVLSFVRSRGAFLLIDGIVRERGAVVKPWRAWAPEANALFRFRLLVGLGAGAVALLAVGLVAAAAYTGGERTPTYPLVALSVLTGLSVSSVGLFAALAIGLADDLVAPLMYARRYRVSDGFRELGGAIGRDPGGFAGYLVIRFAAALAVGLLGAVATVLTCGFAMLPFVGTVVLLPALVFARTLSLEYVSQLSREVHVALHPIEPPAADEGLPLAEPEPSPA